MLKDGVQGAQLAVMHAVEATKKKVSKYIRAHEYEIASTFADADWLEVYSEMLEKGQVDMDLLVKAAMPWDDYKVMLDDSTNPQAEMARGMEVSGVTWQQLGEHAKFLKTLLKELKKTEGSADKERMIAFLARAEDQRGEDASKEALFRKIVADKTATLKAADMKLDSFAALQESLASTQVSKKKAVEAAQNCSPMVQGQLRDLLKSDSSYLNWDSIAA